MSISLETWPRVSRSNESESLINEVAMSEDFRLDSNFFFRLQYLGQSGSPLNASGCRWSGGERVLSARVVELWKTGG